MRKESETIPIFFAVDDFYIPFLAVTLTSLIENASKNYNYDLKILYTSIRDENIRKIKKLESEYVSIDFVDLTSYVEEIKDKLHTRDYYTKTTYFRLFIPELYPNMKKALYLDSDITILGDISELYNESLEDNLVGAVADDVIQTTPIFREYAEQVVGVSTYKKYFNAGVLLMNLEELRKFNFQEKFTYILEQIRFTVAQDQDYLNRLCKGRTKIIDRVWNRMPIYTDKVKEEDIKLIHYNLAYKPWHFDDTLYKKYFWEYAKKTEYYEDILKIKSEYTDEQRFTDIDQYKNLQSLAALEVSCVGDDRPVKWMDKVDKYNIIKKKESGNSIEKYEDRLKILKKIEEYEKDGKFDVDVEDDPPTIPLTLDNVDYLNAKITSRVKSVIANKIGESFLNKLLRNSQLIIKEINGIENLQNVDTGAIITCNHFNPFDSFAIEEVFRVSKQNKKRKLYKVIREGNYTNFPGLYGFFFRNCDTLPLSSNNKTMVEFMKSVDIILKRDDFILIYPEQSMWWNYKKPKPLKDGAFRFAARSNVPVIPIFITMQDSEITGNDGFPIQEYIINIEKPIYPNLDLDKRENAKRMRDENFEAWKKIYEDFYHEPLTYKTSLPTKEIEE